MCIRDRYRSVENKREGLHITFTMIFLVVALLLMLVAVFIGLNFTVISCSDSSSEEDSVYLNESKNEISFEESSDAPEESGAAGAGMPDMDF